MAGPDVLGRARAGVLIEASHADDEMCLACACGDQLRTADRAEMAQFAGR